MKASSSLQQGKKNQNLKENQTKIKKMREENRLSFSKDFAENYFTFLTV